MGGFYGRETIQRACTRVLQHVVAIKPVDLYKLLQKKRPNLVESHYMGSSPDTTLTVTKRKGPNLLVAPNFSFFSGGFFSQTHVAYNMLTI